MSKKGQRSVTPSPKNSGRSRNSGQAPPDDANSKQARPGAATPQGPGPVSFGHVLTGEARVHVLGEQGAHGAQAGRRLDGFGGAAEDLNGTERAASEEEGDPGDDGDPHPPGGRERGDPDPATQAGERALDRSATGPERLLITESSAAPFPDLLAAELPTAGGPASGPAQTNVPERMAAAPPAFPPSGGAGRTPSWPQERLAGATPYPTPIRPSSPPGGSHLAAGRNPTPLSQALRTPPPLPEHQATWPPPGGLAGSGALGRLATPSGAPLTASSPAQLPGITYLTYGSPPEARQLTPYPPPAAPGHGGRLLFFLIGLLVGAFFVLALLDIQSLRREVSAGTGAPLTADEEPPLVVAPPLTLRPTPADAPALRPVEEAATIPAASVPPVVAPPVAPPVVTPPVAAPPMVAPPVAPPPVAAPPIAAPPVAAPPAVAPRTPATQAAAPLAPARVTSGPRPALTAPLATASPSPGAATAPAAAGPVAPAAPAESLADGTLRIEAPAGGDRPRILVDGRPLGRAPVRVQLAPGLHEITVLPDRGYSSMQMVRIQRGKTEVLRLDSLSTHE